MGAKKAFSIGILIISVLTTIPYTAYGQHEVLADSLNSTLLRAAREIITAAQVCTLITIDESGAPRARAMDAFLPDEDFIIWFGTNPQSRKVKQILLDHRVTLYYFDKLTMSYVTILAKAEIITSSKEIDKYWHESWLKFYPDYPQGYLLVKTTPIWLEVISESRGIIGDPLTWQPPKVLFNNR